MSRAVPNAVPGRGAFLSDLRREDSPVRTQALLEDWLAAELGRAAGGSAAPQSGDSLRSLGLDSLAVAQLQEAIGRAIGVRPPLAALSGELTLADLAADLWRRLDQSEDGSAPLPELTPQPSEQGEPFPLNDIQQAYLVGRDRRQELGGVMCHAFYELDLTEFDAERFERALRQVVERHGMLRAAVTTESLQRIEPPPPGPLLDRLELGEEDPEAALAAAREELSHRVSEPRRLPLFAARLLTVGGRPRRLQLSFDLLTVDATSLAIVAAELVALYEDPERELEPIDLGFRDYALAAEEALASTAFEADREYWRRRLPALPPAPELPAAGRAQPGRAGRFRRYEHELGAEAWARLRERAGKLDLTPSALLCAVYAEVVGRFSPGDRFTLNVTTSLRLPLHPRVEALVGEFTSPLPLEVDRNLDPTFAERARRIQGQLWADLEHRGVSGVALLRELARLRGGAAARLPVVFTSLLGVGDGGPDVALRRLGQVAYAISQTPQVHLDHQVYQRGDALCLSWDVREDALAAEVAGEMFSSYVETVERLAEEEDAWEDPEPLRLPPAQRLMQEAANETEGPRPDGGLHDAFERIAAERPEEPALVGDDRTLTYGELDRLSAALARELLARGIERGEIVAVSIPKGWEQVPAVLGVLRAGAAYLPLDPEQPRERRDHMLEQSGCRIAVVPAGSESAATEELETVQLPVGDEPEEKVALAVVEATDLAYVIFTSGSTGKPKGVMIEHGAALNTIADTVNRFGLGPEDRVLALSSLSFDLSVFDILAPLSVGGAIVMPDATAARTPGRWVELIETHGVTVWNSVPSLMRLLVDYLETRGSDGLPRLRLAMLSGDWIPVSLPDRLRPLAPAASVVSLGGATEASIWSIAYPVGSVDPDWDSIPYGRAMRNQCVYVLDAQLVPCPTGVPGELYIGGAGVARGYLADPERTRASFVFHPRSGERLYRTGDLGRWLPDGNVEFLGREDSQVKVHGYRIELGEIESALEWHPEVTAAVARAVRDGAGENRLVAYYTHGPGADVDVDSLRRHLGEKLPGYMVPATLVALEELPLSANGKVDREALDRIDPQERGSTPATPSNEPSEPGFGSEAEALELVSEAAERLLGRSGIDPDADLIELGADSMDLLNLTNWLDARFGIVPEATELGQLTTLRAVAAFCARELGAGEASAGGEADAPMVLVDADARARFQLEGRSVRSLPADLPRIELDAERPPGAYAARRSEREFSSRPLRLQALAGLLSFLRQYGGGESRRRCYPSASGLYPVQVHLAARPGRVDGLEGGAYYYDPVAHRLVALPAGAELSHAAYTPENRPIFDRAALACVLVADLDAIEPMYGPLSRDFCLIEAGLIAQLLMTEAPGQGVGLCPIGAIDDEAVRGALALEPRHRVLHSLLGGPRPA
jgi:amino acid adenylation domain-containing protein